MIFQTMYSPSRQAPPSVLAAADLEKSKLEEQLKYAPAKPYPISQPGSARTMTPVPAYGDLTQAASLSYRSQQVSYMHADPEQQAEYLANLLFAFTRAKMMYANERQLGQSTLGVAWPGQKVLMVKEGLRPKDSLQVIIHELGHILHPDKTERENRDWVTDVLPFKSELPPGYN